ncbi:hypothetical protein JCM3775_004954 [Rhodotorula graminis]
MPRASSTHGTASGASTPEPAASDAAAAAAALEPTTADLVSQPTAAGSPAPLAADDDDADDSGLDPLTQLELGAFGTDAVDDALPAPPRDPNAAAGALGGSGGGGAGAPASGSAGAGAGTPALAGQGAGTKRTLAASGPLARAKRPKNVKFSPAKTGKALARRSAASAVVGDGGPGAYQLPNHDYCDACGGKGHFLCCEGGCLRSFHFSCLEPPLELDEVPEDSWYCKTCRAQVNPPIESRHRFFGELITRVETENPKEFSLPAEIKGFFKNVAVGTNGEYIDAVEHRPPSKITGRAIGQEDRDGFRLKDKNGRPIICYNCDGAANPQQRRRIISCDFCDQHWHLDCLDPPMTGMPPPTRKWMCPLHSDVVIPRKRQPKQTQLVNVDQPYRPNNGDIVVVPRPEPQLQQDVDEMTVNRVRYQVPEQHIILDFWGRITGQKSQPQPPSKKNKGKSPRRRPATGYDSGDSSPLSDLTSSDESGSDAGRSSSRTAAASTAVAPVKVDPSPLDNLALLAEVRYIDYLEQQQQLLPASNGTPVKAATSGGATPGRAHDLPPALPNSTQRRLPSRGLGVPPVGATGSAVASSSTGAGTAAAVKRPSFGGRPSVGGAPFASPAAGPTSSRSRGGSPSVSPAPGKLADVAVESKEDLKALGHVRRLVAAQSKLKEGDAKRAAMLDYLEGALIVPRLQSVGTGTSAAPWSRPWDDKPAGASAAGAAKKPSAAASGSQASPLGSPALAAGPVAASSPATTGSASPAPPTFLPSNAPPSTAAAASAPAPVVVAAPASTAPATVAPTSAPAPTPVATPAPASSANGGGAASTLPASPLPFSLPASSSTSPRAAAAAIAAASVKKEDGGDAGAGEAMDVDAPASAAGINGGA